jgi:hypothetical protein
VDVRRSAPVPLVLLAAIALAGCSSSGGPATSAPPTTASVGSTAAGSSGSAADPATTAAVTKAYKTFFDPATPLATVTRYLQHGSRFTQAIAAQARQGAQQHLGVRVTKVVMLSPNSTAVTFDLLSAGKVLLPGSPGNAVRESGVWKVAAKTFCELVQLTGKAPTACSDPKVTDLPN